MAKEQRLLVRNGTPRRRGGQAVEHPGKRGRRSIRPTGPCWTTLPAQLWRPPLPSVPSWTPRSWPRCGRTLWFISGRSRRGATQPRTKTTSSIWDCSGRRPCRSPIRRHRRFGGIPLRAWDRRGLASALERTFPFGSFSHLYSTTATGPVAGARLTALGWPTGRLLLSHHPCRAVSPARCTHACAASRAWALWRNGLLEFHLPAFPGLARSDAGGGDRESKPALANAPPRVSSSLRRAAGRGTSRGSGTGAGRQPTNPSPWLRDALAI